MDEVASESGCLFDTEWDNASSEDHTVQFDPEDVLKQDNYDCLDDEDVKTRETNHKLCSSRVFFRTAW